LLDGRLAASGLAGDFDKMAWDLGTVILMTLSLGSLTSIEADTAQAEQFSAEFVSAKAGGEVVGPAGKLYVADRKARIETPDLPDTFLIVDAVAPAAYLVRPSQRIFMDAKQSSRLTQYFVPLDPDDPCSQWRTMTEVAGISDQSGQWRCDAEGRESVAGRDTVKFTIQSPRGRSAAWIDSELKFPVRFEFEDGAVFALQNIEEGQQPADKFEIPGNYKKLDPRKILELLKHTDIWVEPPR
jgi:hypothetical protein